MIVTGYLYIFYIILSVYMNIYKIIDIIFLHFVHFNQNYYLK